MFPSCLPRHEILRPSMPRQKCGKKTIDILVRRLLFTVMRNRSVLFPYEEIQYLRTGRYFPLQPPAIHYPQLGSYDGWRPLLRSITPPSLMNLNSIKCRGTSSSVHTKRHKPAVPNHLKSLGCFDELKDSWRSEFVLLSNNFQLPIACLHFRVSTLSIEEFLDTARWRVFERNASQSSSWLKSQ